MQLVLDTRGARVRRRNGCFQVRAGEEVRLISPVRVTSILVSAPAMLSSSALCLAAQHGIPVLVLQRSGRLGARVYNADRAGHVRLRRSQSCFPEHSDATSWCIDLLHLKLSGQVRVLGLLAEHRGGQREAIATARKLLHQQQRAMKTLAGMPLEQVRSRLMGHEGTAARTYWSTVGSLLPAGLRFKERSRRPANDTFNACLNYAYAIMLGHVDVAAMACGMDTDMGVLHTDLHGRPSYSLDLLEAVRPWVDELLVGLALDDRLLPDWCTPSAKGPRLRPGARRELIPAFNAFLEARCQFNGRRSSRRSHLMRFARQQTERISKTMP